MRRHETQARQIRTRRPLFSERAAGAIEKWGLIASGTLAAAVILNYMNPSSGKPTAEPATPTPTTTTETSSTNRIQRVQYGPNPDTFAGTTIELIKCKTAAQIGENNFAIGIAIIPAEIGNWIHTEPDISSHVVGHLTKGEVVAADTLAIVKDQHSVQIFARVEPGYVHVESLIGESIKASIGNRGLSECLADQNK